MSNTIFVQYLTKKYPVTISKPTDLDYAEIDTAIQVECKDAEFSQIRDSSDLDKLLDLLPELIGEKKLQRKKSLINIRLTQEEKNKVESLAKANGFDNVSSYIRTKILQN